MRYFLFILLLHLLMPVTGVGQTCIHPDPITVLADSIHLEGEYTRAFSLREEALRTYQHISDDYRKHLQAKLLHTKACMYEYNSYNYHNPDAPISKSDREQYLDSALNAVRAARDIYAGARLRDKMFQYNIQNRIYHETAYLGNWRDALEQAGLGLEILTDTLSETDKKFVDLIYDLGYIYGQLGDYSNAVTFYQRSLDRYIGIIGKYHTDVAQAYNNIAVEYRRLGLRLKELEALNAAREIWEQLNDPEDNRFIYNCYNNLFFWYSSYGDLEKAEEFLIKKNKFYKDHLLQKGGIVRNQEEYRREQLSFMYNRFLLLEKQENAQGIDKYATLLFKAIPERSDLTDFEVSYLSSMLIHYATYCNATDPEKAMRLIDDAISVNYSYENIYFTRPLISEKIKAELLVRNKRYREANALIGEILTKAESEKAPERLQLYILKAECDAALKEPEKAEKYFDKAFRLVLLDSLAPIDEAGFDQLKPYISFESIDGFLGMGDFYLSEYHARGRTGTLLKAYQRYLIASRIFNALYQGNTYNPQLYVYFQRCNAGLLNTLQTGLLPRVATARILEEIENNGSRLLWSKFNFNSERKRLRIPEEVIRREEELNAELQFYQDKQHNSENEDESKRQLWKEKEIELRYALEQLQDSLKIINKSYYSFAYDRFDLADFRKQLKPDHKIMKYVFTDENVFMFTISHDSLNFQTCGKSEVIRRMTRDYLELLVNRKPGWERAGDSLCQVLVGEPVLDRAKKWVIIPDDILFYLPFEAMVMSEKMPSISYSTSLLLLEAQNSQPHVTGDLRVAAFASSPVSQPATFSSLPNTVTEAKIILSRFNGSSFVNVSKDKFLRIISKYNAIHIATHSKIDDQNPDYSALYFFGPDGESTLYLSELYNRSIPAEMVVLSACETGGGVYKSGEGVISLSRAFTYAGVPSTVMSLWKVDDEATATIMKFFYAHLSSGLSKDEALRNAKQDYLASTDDPLLRHPYYWAGFVVSGNTDALVPVASPWWKLLIIAALGLPALFLLRLFFQRLF